MSIGTLILGNSVSAQKDGYAASLEADTCIPGILPIVNASLGGVGSIGLVALNELLTSGRRAELVILETSLGDAAGATALDDLPMVLGELCDQATAIAERDVLALHIPRFDVSAETRAVFVSAHEEVLRARGIPSIDFSDTITEKDTVDGVHLALSGSRTVARGIAKFLGETRQDQQHTPISEELPLSLDFIPISHPRWRTTGETSSFRATLSTTRIGESDSAEIRLSGVEPLALVVIVGPRSGVISISSQENSVTIQTWDQWCTFRRIQIVHVPRSLRAATLLKMRPRLESIAGIDAWGMDSVVDHAGDILEVAGILARGLAPTGLNDHE
jgi:hypothetical protein